MSRSGKGEGGSRSPTEVDRLVGANVRRLRAERSQTLADLAAELGVSHQQLQKYETGANRLSAGMLCSVAEVLGVSIEYLFRRDGDTGPQTSGRQYDPLDELRSEGTYWLGRAQSEQTLRQMVRVLKALSANS